ncbi:MAG: methyltransferase domain-containing protein [Planctomycetota bacterium]
MRVAGPDTLRGTRCVRCGAGELEWFGEPEAIRCRACGARYGTVGGAPFLGDYVVEDLGGLLEIAAVADALREPPEMDFALWERVCERYHFDRDESAAREALGASAVYLPNRYNEWALLRTLLHGLDLSAKNVLDVGAGFGSDAWRLSSLGALVTALEYNPFLVAAGQRCLPEARWFGGFSHVLPFQDGSFDFVFANAALHHMRDIPASISEFLRVLRPGGWLLTSCDSFRANETPESLELEQFDAMPEVLLGVNERTPRLDEFFASLREHAGSLSVEVISADATGAADGLGIPLRHPTAFGLEDAGRALDQASGSIALRVRCDRSIGAEAPTQAEAMIGAEEFVRLCADRHAAVGRLAVHISEEYVNPEIPMRAHDKFMLQSGWRRPRGAEWQEAFGRANLFLRCSGPRQSLLLDVEAIGGPHAPDQSLVVSINGVEAGRFQLVRGLRYELPQSLADAPVDQAFLVTLTVDESPSFEDRVLRVRSAVLSEAPGGSARVTGLGSRPGLRAICEHELGGRRPRAVLFLPGDRDIIRVLSTLRERFDGRAADLVLVPEPQRFLYEPELEGEEALATYRVDPGSLREALASATPEIVIWPSETALPQSVRAILEEHQRRVLQAPADRLLPSGVRSLLEGPAPRGWRSRVPPSVKRAARTVLRRVRER